MRWQTQHAMSRFRSHPLQLPTVEYQRRCASLTPTNGLDERDRESTGGGHDRRHTLTYRGAFPACRSPAIVGVGVTASVPQTRPPGGRRGSVRGRTGGGSDAIAPVVAEFDLAVADHRQRVECFDLGV